MDTTLGHPAPARLVHAAVVALVLILGLAWPIGASRAAADPAEAPRTGLDAALEAEVRALALAAATPPGVTRLEVVLGQLDPRLRLAPCAKVEPYLGAGTRLWGKTRIGLRCVHGPLSWNVFLPVTIKAFGPALVATRGSASGAVLVAADVAAGEVDLAEESGAVLSDVDQVAGRTLAVALKPGQALRQTHLKARVWFSAGETIKLVAEGEGFSLEGEGVALSNGVEGQIARVRVESGRVLTGQPAGPRRMALIL